MESDENGVFDHSTGTPAENIEALDNMAEGKKFILSLPTQNACMRMADIIVLIFVFIPLNLTCEI